MNDCKMVIDASDDEVQSLVPPNRQQRFEGIAFSPSGNIIAVAGADTNTVFLFHRRADGGFEDAPYGTIGGPGSRLNYPHDVSFAPAGDSEVLAVAQRGNAIAIFAKHRSDDLFETEPVCEISGRDTKLSFSDGVAFVPPRNNYLAACNLERGTVSFYRRTSLNPISFKLKPVWELKHPSLVQPDGLAFSTCGGWLAVANHGNHTVSIFQRRKRFLFGGHPRFGPDPVTIIEDPGLLYTHSVAFTPKTNHLVVTNAGANYFSIYQPHADNAKLTWSQTAVMQQIVGPEQNFREINGRNKMEGGPKGVAIDQNHIAICSPEFGIKIYSYREGFVAG